MATTTNDEKTRLAVMGAYPSKKWRDKVEKMSPDQIVAIFMRLKAQNKL